MKLHELRELIKLVNQSSIEELEWEKGKERIVIKKSEPAAVSATPFPVQTDEVDQGYQQAAATAETATLAVEKEQETPAPEKTPQLVLSTSVGLFYAQVKVGQTIKADDVIGRCTVDALQLSSDIVSTANGVVAEMLVQDGQLVDYGKPLLVVKPQ